MSNNNAVSVDNRFAIIPHWIILSDVSDSALRLYAVLTKYADNDSKQAWPSRTTLAKDIRKSEKTVDRAIKELISLGALIVKRRTRKGSKEFRSSMYTLITARPAGDPKEVAPPMSPPSVTNDAVTIPTELDPPYFTSEQDSEQMLHPHSYERGRENKKSAGELADPISPQWYASEDRQIIISNIMSIATAKTAKDPVTAGHGVNMLYDNLCAAFSSDGDGLDGLIWDYNWEPKKPQATKLAAAIWLNQLLNAWQAEVPVTWRGARPSV